MEPEVKVTRIKDRWHARLMNEDKVFDEMACDDSRDIGWICREMLRWYAKLGGTSLFAMSARERQIGATLGKIWYKDQLQLEKDKIE